MVEIIALIFAAVCVMALCFVVGYLISSHEKQRQEWNAEREKLLDRIQSGSLSEFKAQERAVKPIPRPNKDASKDRLEREAWL